MVGHTGEAGADDRIAAVGGHTFAAHVVGIHSALVVVEHKVPAVAVGSHDCFALDTLKNTQVRIQ